MVPPAFQDLLAPPYGGVFLFKSPLSVIGLNCHTQTVTQGGPKAMDEGIAIVLAAILGSGLSLFISELFRYIHAKKEREERFFYEIYPKRMELYEEIIKNLAFIDDVESISRAESAVEISAVYTQGVKRLLALNFRCRLFGSSRVTAAVGALAKTVHGHDEFIMTHQELFDSDLVAPVLLDPFTEAIAAQKGAIMKLIQAEAGTDLVDKKIFNLIPIKNYKDKHGSDNAAKKKT
jgi:hypothetical protein